MMTVSAIPSSPPMVEMWALARCFGGVLRKRDADGGVLG